MPQSADTEQQTRVAFLRAKLNSCCMCLTRQSFFRVKLDLKCNIKGRDKTREIKKKQDGPSLESSLYLNMSLRYPGPWEIMPTIKDDKCGNANNLLTKK